ncbi:MAG TPA: non-heme iron oxygenase ferredoxin subunit [Nitrososphaeraceae archaeon]|jgi:nitrite reductase/ring-hydroxylating ferredoxin subunit|nr:non-heme iron oxygenase ferredoxin subunit [Nitrososphaeraceae archaeon]
MVSWIKACEAKTLNNGDMIDFDYDDKKILISNVNNKIYATDRICTHAYADLSSGFVNEDEITVTCPLHMSRFNLESGVPENLPAEEPLKTYSTEIRDGWVYILI